MRRRASLGRILASLVAWGCALVLPADALAQAPANEAEAKVRFVLTLARFVQWPAPVQPTPPDAAPGAGALRLCVVHDSPLLAAAFGSQRGALVTGRPVSVVLHPAPRGEPCDLLFVDASAARAAADALAGQSGRAVLTLGAVDGFLSQGGMVELVNVDDALRFDVNLKALRAAQLGLNAHVLKLARQVRE